MADEADLASRFADDYNEQCLANHFSKVGPPRPGRTTCVDCGEPIAPHRTRLGAVLCIDCQRDADLRSQAVA